MPDLNQTNCKLMAWVDNDGTAHVNLGTANRRQVPGILRDLADMYELRTEINAMSDGQEEA